jgi:hypothetical protein
MSKPLGIKTKPLTIKEIANKNPLTGFFGGETAVVGGIEYVYDAKDCRWVQIKKDNNDELTKQIDDLTERVADLERYIADILMKIEK